MLPQKNRISREDFPSSKVKGFRVFSPLFSAVFYKTSTSKATEARVSVVVSKKTAKTAVVRNRLRRRFYDATAPYLDSSGEYQTIVIYPKKEAITASFQGLIKEIKKAILCAR